MSDMNDCDAYRKAQCIPDDVVCCAICHTGQERAFIEGWDEDGMCCVMAGGEGYVVCCALANWPDKAICVFEG